MNFKEAYKNLSLKFTSANEIPVGRATITREEWLALKQWLDQYFLQQDLSKGEVV